MTIEEYIILYLSGRLSVPVSGDVPSPVPISFVTVEKTGARSVNRVESATIILDVWAASRDAAARLCAEVEAIMAGIIAEPEISRCSLDTSYNSPDLERNLPRYRASFSITHYL